MADPFIMRYDGWYYPYCTGAVNIWRSKDLARWVIPIKTNAPPGIIRYEPKYFISSSCNDIVATMVLLRCLEWDKDVYTMFRYGLENTDYIMTQNGMDLTTCIISWYISLKTPIWNQAHDFGLWDEFFSEFISSQSANKSSYEYENRLTQLVNTIKQLNNSDPETKELSSKRVKLNDGISAYIRSKTGSYNEYLRKYDLHDTDDLKSMIKANMDIHD